VRPPDDDTAMKALEGRTVRGTYRLGEQLGAGGFGAVFRSDQSVLGLPLRSVALKLSRRTRLSVENAREVLADALLLAEAMDSITDTRSRQHLVHVYDAGITQDHEARAYLVMELVRGTTLATQFSSLGKVPAPLLRKWVIQVCQALRGLHRLDPPLMHRDLKPPNVLLGTDNTVRLVDFGLSAKMLQIGYAPGVAGTLEYMAPETSRGQSSPASDVYGVGLLLHEGLTGAHPFHDLVPPLHLPDALHADWLYEAKRRQRAAPPSTLNNTVTPELDEIVLRCLEFEPGDRYQDGGELLEALSQGQTPLRAAEQALRESRELRAEGQVEDALREVEKALTGPSLGKHDRFLLLREKGEVLGLLGEHDNAAGALVDAWQLTEKTAILRTAHDRAALLARLAGCYRLTGNTFQAKRYETLRAKELGDGR
jgi:serine/threonine protein kinase